MVVIRFFAIGIVAYSFDHQRIGPRLYGILCRIDHGIRLHIQTDGMRKLRVDLFVKDLSVCHHGAAAGHGAYAYMALIFAGIYGFLHAYSDFRIHPDNRWPGNKANAAELDISTVSADKFPGSIIPDNICHHHISVKLLIRFLRGDACRDTGHN